MGSVLRVNPRGLTGRGTTRAEDAQGTPNQSHMSPSILVYEVQLLTTHRSPLTGSKLPEMLTPSWSSTDRGVLNLRLTTSQKCGAVPRRARIFDPWTFESLNSRLESNEEEEALTVDESRGAASLQTC